jgi:hypothetical protein
MNDSALPFFPLRQVREAALESVLSETTLPGQLSSDQAA